MRRLAPLLLVALAVLPVEAAESGWTELGPAMRARLVTGETASPDGTLMVGLELDLAEGARTYWQRAGEAGIGTLLDAGASRGVTLDEVLWPLPEVLIEAGLMEYVYRADTVIPLRVRVSGPDAELRLALSGGVCTDICMPVSGTLSLPVPPIAPDPAGSLRLSLALAEVPVPWAGKSPPFILAACGTEGLTLTGLDPAIDPKSLILEETGSDALYVPAADRGRFSRLSRVAAGENPAIRALFSSTMGSFVVETRCPSTAAGG